MRWRLTPEATAAAGSGGDGFTSSSPVGVSGDSGKDAGGYGDGPDDVDCPLKKRGLFSLRRRCSRTNRPNDWTAYDDIRNNKPDTALDALKIAIDAKQPGKVYPDLKTAYVGIDDISQRSFEKDYFADISDEGQKDSFI